MNFTENEDFEITRYLTKRDLVEANDAAIREKRSKTLSRTFVDNLPDDFIFVVVTRYFHTKHEMRLGITIDLKSNWGLLDVSMTRFNSLPISKTYKDGRVEFEPPEEIEKRRPYPDGRQWQETLTKKPLRKQGKFREIVLVDAYDHQCAICEVIISALLRAAHIVPVVNGGDDSIQNGICLCANHEIAFDAGLLKIFPDGSAYLYNKPGQELERLTIRLPVDEILFVRKNAISRQIICIQLIKIRPLFLRDRILIRQLYFLFDDYISFVNSITQHHFCGAREYFLMPEVLISPQLYIQRVKTQEINRWNDLYVRGFCYKVGNDLGIKSYTSAERAFNFCGILRGPDSLSHHSIAKKWVYINRDLIICETYNNGMKLSKKKYVILV